MARVEITGQQFFEALQEVAAQTSKDPAALGAADKLADAGLLPAFIASLPYKSDILSMDDEMFAALTADERSDLDQQLTAKAAHYRQINESDRWIQLNESDAPDAAVYPLSLEALP